MEQGVGRSAQKLACIVAWQLLDSEIHSTDRELVAVQDDDLTVAKSRRKVRNPIAVRCEHKPKRDDKSL